MNEKLSKFKEWINAKAAERNLLGNSLNFLKWVRICYHDSTLVNWMWFLELKLRNLFSRRIKVGFGPILSPENTLSSRKWHIDPIVNYINRHNKKYVCDIFFVNDDLSRFDIIIDVRNFDNLDQAKIERLKRNNKILIYDVCDNPRGGKKDCFKETWFLKLMDGIIINNPLQGEMLKDYQPNLKLIILPIINRRYKKNFRKNGPVNILWEGYAENMEFTKNKMNTIIKKLKKEVNYEINMIYHSNIPSKNEGTIKYVKWRLSNWERVLVNSDIGVVVKPPDNVVQQRKPSTKVNTYRAAGLPVICVPSEADKLVIEHGKTGFIVRTDEDWYEYLKMLINNPDLRREIGNAGRKYVLENFNVGKVVQNYIDFFEELIAKKQNILFYQRRKPCMD